MSSAQTGDVDIHLCSFLVSCSCSHHW